MYNVLIKVNKQNCSTLFTLDFICVTFISIFDIFLFNKVKFRQLITYSVQFCVCGFVFSFECSVYKRLFMWAIISVMSFLSCFSGTGVEVFLGDSSDSSCRTLLASLRTSLTAESPSHVPISVVLWVVLSSLFSASEFEVFFLFSLYVPFSTNSLKDQYIHTHIWNPETLIPRKSTKVINAQQKLR
jgi:hypothetical protein